jgi:hypothetical protein
MRYLEIYGADILDASLATTIQQANTNLIAKGLQCNSASAINQTASETGFIIYPNPATETLNISFMNNAADKQQIEIYNSMGSLIKEMIISEPTQLNIANLPNGLYFVRLKNNSQLIQKFIKQ